jgi:hypothetical protein
MNRLILNTLGFNVGDASLILPGIRNGQERKRIEFGREQIELVMRRYEQKGEKGNMCRYAD